MGNSASVTQQPKRVHAAARTTLHACRTSCAFGPFATFIARGAPLITSTTLSRSQKRQRDPYQTRYQDASTHSRELCYSYKPSPDGSQPKEHHCLCDAQLHHHMPTRGDLVHGAFRSNQPNIRLARPTLCPTCNNRSKPCTHVSIVRRPTAAAAGSKRQDRSARHVACRPSAMRHPNSRTASHNLAKPSLGYIAIANGG